MDKDSTTLWYDPNHEWPPYLNWMDELLPLPGATILFRDSQHDSIVVGVRNSALDKSWSTVWLAFDYLSLDLRSDTSKSIANDYKYSSLFSVGNVAARFISATTGIITPEKLMAPANFALEQNYPNPFNPVTNFRFSIADVQFVELKVFDLLGREVTTVVSERKPAGTYTAQWNATRFASGAYFYRLQAGSFSDTKKLLLLK